MYGKHKKNMQVLQPLSSKYDLKVVNEREGPCGLDLHQNCL